MPQSLFTDPQYIEFDKYTKLLMRKIDTYDLDERERHIQNWLKGRLRMEQLAHKYKTELKTPYPLFARRDEIDNITWVKSEVNGKPTIWGIWKGEDHIKVEYEGELRHVFNDGYLDFLADGYKDKEKAKKMFAKLFVAFDGKEQP